MSDEPLLSICCITYNQKNYIKKALDSFLMQKTDFPFVVIVGDDCSNDGTRDIVELYAKKYPDIIKPIFQEKNIGSCNNLCSVLNTVNSKYVALCEGDDYWTNENKLQKQVDLMEKNQDCTICFHKTLYKFEEGFKKDYEFPNFLKGKKRLCLKDLLRRNFIQTNSVVYRWQFKDKKISDYIRSDIMPLDWYIHLLHAKQGDILFINECMGVYRINPNGIWYNAFKNPEKLHLEYGMQEIGFVDNIYRNIADKSVDYLDMQYKHIRDIINAYAKNNEFNKLEEAYKKFGHIFNRYFLRNEKELRKRKKREKLYQKIIFFLSGILIILIILILSIFLILY